MTSIDEVRRIKAEAERALLALPGVTGVDIGFKEVGGRKTDTWAIRVLVEKKKELETIPPEERIPEQIDGIPTDVIERSFRLH